MKQVTFPGSLPDVYNQAEEWKKANPKPSVIDPVVPMRVGNQVGEGVYKAKDWTLTLHYEERPSN